MLPVATNFTCCVGEHLLLQELLAEHRGDILTKELDTVFGRELVIFTMSRQLGLYLAHQVLRMRSQRLHLERCLELPVTAGNR